jgi:hypothetical protein
MYRFLSHLDRRWIFLLMLLCVAIPILTGVYFPVKASPMARSVFATIDNLPEGSKVLMAFDYDPPSMGELAPMAHAFTRHCAIKKHKLYFMTLWPQGPPMIERSIAVLNKEFPDYKYGEDYVNIGFRPGNEGVIKVVVTNIKELYETDVSGQGLDKIPMTKDVKSVQDLDLIVNVSAGFPGAKEWVQYAASAYKKPMVAGTTGVGAPVLYPYVPNQLTGLLGAIKAAAEYEQTIIEHYPEQKENKDTQEALRRMGPQDFAHLLIISLILVGNWIYFAGKKRGQA